MRWCIGALTVLVAAGIGVGIYAAATGLPDVGFVLVLLSAAAVPAGLYWVRKPGQWGKPRPSGSEHEDVAEIPHGHGLITVHRPAGYPYALLRAYKVEIDGRVVAEVRRGESVSVSVPAGEHAVRARIDWGGSPTVTIELSAGRRAALSVTPGRPIAAFIRPSEVLDLVASR